MPPDIFPLRWESTGDQWWFASPIDWAAANGHYDLVRELLSIDPNLLIKLTSLPRIKRLETVWDDEEKFNDVSKCRSQVAHRLLQECETKEGKNSLIMAGYGGWLVYTAAAAGDVIFVKELLEKDPNLVFGEGEYGVTDIFYAAARSKNSEVFMMLFDYSLLIPKGEDKEISSFFRSEMVNRAVHAASRGGNVEMLRLLFKDTLDVLCFKDFQGSTVLHSASGRGQVEVVKFLLSNYDIVTSVDNRGNSALHIATYLGHLPVIEVLLSSSLSSASLTNNYGDTFLHMAVAGFKSPTFRRLDRQIELIKQLVNGKLINIEDIINIQNNDGRTPLHMAVIANIQYDVVELIMSVRYIDLNLRDLEGNTPLDILKQRPRSASSEILIKRLIAAGGISNCQDKITRNALVSHLRMHGIGGSPGTVFAIPDAEIFLYTGIVNGFSGEIKLSGLSNNGGSFKHRRFASIGNAAGSFKMLLRWPTKKERNINMNSDKEEALNSEENRLIRLRDRFPRLHVPQKLNMGSPSEPCWDSPGSVNEEKEANSDGKGSLSSSNRSPMVDRLKMKRRQGSFNLKVLNNYLCFGSHGLTAEKMMKTPPMAREDDL